MGSRCRHPSLFLSSLFLLYNLSSFCYAASTLTRGRPIRDGGTIISEGNNFQLGFFSPVNSTNRYVGIWYYKVSVQTVVWVANRDNPVLDTNGVFTIGGSGNLMVLDGNGNSLWSTNVSAVSGNSTAYLTDSGNLILSTGNDAGDTGNTLWQSFDDPTDTYLPGMKASLNLRTGNTRLFVSWKSANDPSIGNYSMGVDPVGSPQIVMWEGSKRRWRSGQWNGQTFMGVPNMRPLYIYGFRLVNDEEGGLRYFTYTMTNSTDILKFRIRWDGIEDHLLWNSEKKEWTTIWSQPVDECELYNQCGTYGICNRMSSPVCTCLQGFEPKSPLEWSRGNWSGGCVRRTQLQCQRNSSVENIEGDGFLKVQGIKLPDFSNWVSIQGRGECEDECLKNCSCRAYAYVNGVGCMLWERDLVDIQHFPEGGNTLYIRLADSELGQGGMSKILKLVIIIIALLGFVFLSLSIYLLWRFNAKRKVKGSLVMPNKELPLPDLSISEELSKDLSVLGDAAIEAKQGDGPELPLFNFNFVAFSTNNFSDANKLGEGGFGPVYKGKLPCGREVAVKRLSRRSGQGLEEFKNEIILIAKLQHRNLVRLLGCCIQGEEKILLYEFMPNSSLDSFIFEPERQGKLEWGKRFNIIEGIARGLLYLHRDSRLRIIHRDLKASNILLDEEMNPRISDFGMAKIFGGNQNEANTTRVVGTYGYMSPEYAMEGLFSVKSDVYSFGVLLLEIVSGRRNTHFRSQEHSLNLLGYAWKLWIEDKAMEFIDPSISGSCSKWEVLRCIHVGLLCVQDSAMDRPTMSSVILMLESETATLPVPKQPTFTIVRNHPTDVCISVESHEIASTNDVTVTMIVGR
ncbi:PREDICTED: G-type lectin S-receptor-like serine/threonine-protein kinase B120 [Nelumbo nucifera]|uniref:Receptor-like serine/threonine-protein kinase n=2 Tax=Nelumbo nucifera TaxID=4432 RepID=A0A822XT05_NELNU|nr:PREDICTED: G-type lectin S-receptor-like serine/threonine-protein kinase B120 [Nelumbo nucifera]DAD23142.1 TPA_asm: hypothetical protein HUJ06_024605 [Nelumbo nucifera]